MKRTNKILFCLTLIGLGCILGCAAPEKTASEWLGTSEGELIATLGQPDNTVVTSDARKILTWNRYESPTQAVPCRHSYTIGLDGNIEEFVTSNCAPKQLFPIIGSPQRGF